jgi:hypothetical protein
MRHTILILILAVMAGVAAGQQGFSPKPPDPVYPVGIVGGPYISPKYPYLDSLLRGQQTDSILPLPDWRTTPITAGLLEEYIMDCYNDSTLWERHKDNGTCVNDSKTGICIFASHWTNFYKHKQPSLPGLLAWIKRKYKEK